jgi:mycothiol synthase
VLGCDLVIVSGWQKAMSNSPYYIRNYQSADFHKYVLLCAEAQKLESSGRCVSPQFVAEQLERPNYSPEQDLFMAGIDEIIVGYVNVTPELAIRRVVLDCWVHPEHRRRGLATKLLGHASNRARGLGAKVVHVNVAEDNVVAGRVLSRLGFSLVRRFLELRLNIADVWGLDIGPAATGCRCLQLDEENKLTQLQNCAFADTWGYNPNTVAEIAFQTSLSNFSLHDIMLIHEGDRAIGYCWIGTIFEKGVPSARVGRILMLGVPPDYRGKGIGKKLVLAGITRLKSKGLQVAELTVDSENKAACALYKSLGFEVQTSTLWYEKTIN